MGFFRGIWDKLRSVPWHVWVGLGIGAVALVVALYELNKNANANAANTPNGLPNGINPIDTSGGGGGGGSGITLPTPATPATPFTPPPAVANDVTATGNTQIATGTSGGGGGGGGDKKDKTISQPTPAQAIAQQVQTFITTANQTGNYAPVADLTRPLPGASGAIPVSPPPAPPPTPSPVADKWWQDPNLQQPVIPVAHGGGGGGAVKSQ